MKFFFLTFLLLFARGCDFYSTSLWFFQQKGVDDETNPMTSFFGLGWTGLIIGNLVIVGMIIYAFYYYTFKYSIKITSTRPDKLTDYVSELYYNQAGRFYQIFYKIPKDRNSLLGHAGYVLVRVLIVASFLASIHNLCQYYQFSLYDTYRNIIKRPLFVIFGLIGLSVIYFSYRIWLREYELVKRNFDLPNPEE